MLRVVLDRLWLAVKQDSCCGVKTKLLHRHFSMPNSMGLEVGGDWRRGVIVVDYSGGGSLYGRGGVLGIGVANYP